MLEMSTNAWSNPRSATDTGDVTDVKRRDVRIGPPRGEHIPSGSGSRQRLYVIATLSYCFDTFLRGQPAQLADTYDVTLVTSPAASLAGLAEREGVRVLAMPFTRSITPVRDFVSLVRLCRLFRRERPAIVQSYTPKAGLLAMVAARMTGVPVRVHGIIGMPLMEARGVRRPVLRITELITYACSTHLTTVSTGLRTWVRESLVDRPITLVANGSINGVDLDEFRLPTSDERLAARVELGYSPDEHVFLYVGRLVPDKGVGELLAAFKAVAPTAPTARLLLVGDPDVGGDWTERIRTIIDTDPAMARRPFTADVVTLYHGADFFVLPSYREGMPNVLLEAAACGLPLIATDIIGSNEVVEEDSNGFIVPPKDSGALSDAMLRALSADRAALSANARSTVVSRYGQGTFFEALLAFYREAAGRTSITSGLRLT